ncbi:MAG: acyl-CoA/acyl-ACP dehydrogenase [Verrucomicrobia bacterium]|nr:acyl-CoA/acyl-ACP dehydrogenase [Verrucomicrobiota bacterium]
MSDATMTTGTSIFSTLPDSELLNPAGYSPEFLRSVLRTGELRGLFGTEATAEGRLETVRQCALVSVEMALSLGITASLFAHPVSRFAPEIWHRHLEEGFLTGGMLGGMMITEPGCGTDISACETLCREVDGALEITGVKHWAGLSGLADYWLVLARDVPPGAKHRFPSLNFYICRADPESFKLLKRYGSAGLRSIPYGMTRIAAREGVMGPLFSGSRTERFRRIHGVLHRSRISIAAITCGACERIATEIAAHATTRRVFGRALADYGQVQARLAEIEAARDVSRLLFKVACRESAAADAANGDVNSRNANVVKVVASDIAFASATSASQLLGGESYRTDTYIGRATADLRPFRIFEGSNDVLCDAIWQAAEKSGRTGGESFQTVVTSASQKVGLPGPDLSPFACAGPDGALPQGLRCLGGRILAQAVCIEWCLTDGLAPAACRPLVARMLRDVDTATAWGPDAGLIEY